MTDRMKKFWAAFRTFPCKAWDWLTCSGLLWALLCVLFALVWVFVTYFEAPVVSNLVPQEIDPFVKTVLSDKVTRDGILAFVAAAISVAATFVIFVVPRRKAVLKALADGYFKNFIKRIVPSLRESKKKLLIMKPNYEVFDVTDYEDKIASDLSKNGLYVETGAKLGLGRDTRVVWLVKEDKDASPSVYFDLARNLSVLRDLTDREMSFPAFMNMGLCRHETKYRCLRNSYFSTLHSLYSKMYEPNVIFIDSDDMKAVADTLRANMS